MPQRAERQQSGTGTCSNQPGISGPEKTGPKRPVPHAGMHTFPVAAQCFSVQSISEFDKIQDTAMFPEKKYHRHTFSGPEIN